jgi:hypothetical protein
MRADLRLLPPAWLGADGAAPRTVAEIWGTVDLERALAAFRATAGAYDPVSIDPRDALDDPLLGARVLLLTHEGRRTALAEPSTEGRLAAALARHGEGRVGAYVEAPLGLDAVRARAAAANVLLSRPATGPLGRSVLVAPGTLGGPLLILVERAVPSRS